MVVKVRFIRIWGVNGHIKPWKVIIVETEELDVYMIADPQIELHPSTSIEHLAELAESIKQQGLINPITVRKVDEHYQLIAGHNRLKAAKKFGIPKLLSRVVEMSDKDALIAGTTENIMRSNQDPIQEGKLYQELKETHKMAAKDIAEKFGKSETYVYSRIRMLELPEMLHHAIRAGALAPSTASEVLRIPNRQEQIMVGHDLARNRSKQRDAKMLVDSYLAHKQKMKDAPEEEVLEKAHVSPQMRCDFCLEMRDLDLLRGRNCCKTCDQKLAYMLEKYTLETKPEPADVKK